MQRRTIFVVAFVILAGLVQCTRKMSTENSPGIVATGGNSLSIFRQDFSLSSIPTPLLEENSDGRSWGRLVWYNPYGQYLRRYIWPNRNFPLNVAQTQSILIFEFTPDSLVQPSSASWAGIMQHIDKDPLLFVKRKYLEIMLNTGALNSVGPKGLLHIDFGRISEDVIPNGILDTEDKANQALYNGLVDEGEDTGLDGMANDDSRAIAAGGDFWDINGNGVKETDEPFSNDDWYYSPFNAGAGGIDYSHINGTENNKNDSNGRVPNSEDLNGNSVLDLDNSYFSFALHLSPDHEDYGNYVVYKAIKESTGDDYGWRLYRIPLEGWDEIGSPSWEDVKTMRLWLDGFEEEAYIAIASIELTDDEP